MGWGSFCLEGPGRIIRHVVGGRQAQADGRVRRGRDRGKPRGAGVPRVRREVLQAWEAHCTQPEIDAEAWQAKPGLLSSGRSAKPSDETERQHPAPRRCRLLTQVKCNPGSSNATPWDYGAFNLPTVAFTRSGDPSLLFLLPFVAQNHIPFNPPASTVLCG